MAYLAKSNLALSVTITAMTTILAVVLHTAVDETVEGTLVEVKPVAMMLEIVKIVVVPIGAAMLHDYLKFARETRTQNCSKHRPGSGAALGWDFLCLEAGTGFNQMDPHTGLTAIGITGSVWAQSYSALVYHQLTMRPPKIGRAHSSSFDGRDRLFHRGHHGGGP